MSKFTAILCLFLLATLSPTPAQTPVYQNPIAPLETRVADLLSRLTPEEKLSLLTGTGFATRAIPRLGVPEMRMADAPQGVRGGPGGTLGPATLFPSQIAMAATWNPALISKVGAALGQEARGKGQGIDILLGPCVNIHRSPQGGRNTESYSEDPYLAAQIGVAYIQGVQSQGTAACVKHFACNNEETDRDYVDVRVSERALHEIYLPAFEAAVQEGHVWSLMSSYNQVNGAHSSANKVLLTDILRSQWSFDGLVMSDWGGVHETAAVVNAGNDLEMPGGDFLTVPKLTAALKNNQITQAGIEEADRRILRAIIRVGLLDGPKPRDPNAVNSEAHRALAQEAASEAIVLLKNKNGILPLNRSRLRSVAVIGPEAAVGRLGGRGSAEVHPVFAVSPLDGLKKRLGPTIRVTYVEGTGLGGDGERLPSVPASALSALNGQYFANRDLTGTPALTRSESALDFDWHSGSPAPGLPATSWSARFQGRLTAPKTGNYTLGLSSDDGSRLYLDDQLLIDNWGDHATQQRTASVSLTAGQFYSIRIEYYQNAGESSLHFGWRVPSDTVQTPFAEAVQAAKNAEIALVFVGASEEFEGEGLDRADLNLPGQQAALIQAVVRANPRTVVILESGTPILMNSWIGAVPAVLQAWYPGEAGGDAIASVLLGAVNPSGKLPDTYALARADYPDTGHFPGRNGVVDYSEGIYVGYRHFDRKRIATLFPFGFGLSYTSFAYSHLQCPRSYERGQTATVSIILKNTGSRAGAEVAQLYVRSLAPTVDRPVRELKGFRKAFLQPGQSQTVTFALNDRSFAYWDETAHHWRVDPGRYAIEIGASSRDIRMTQEVTIR